MPSVTAPGVGDIREVPPSVWQSPFKTERPEHGPGSVQAPERAVCRPSVGKEERVRDLSYLMILFSSPLFKTKRRKSPGYACVRNTESWTGASVCSFSVASLPGEGLQLTPETTHPVVYWQSQPGPPACLSL